MNESFEQYDKIDNIVFSAYTASTTNLNWKCKDTAYDKYYRS